MNRSLKQIVDSYGVHEAPDGIRWLLQQGLSSNAFGLPEKDCPFRIKTHLLLCSHQFMLNTQLTGSDPDVIRYEELLKKSKLLQFLDPASSPEHKILYIETDEPSYYQTIAAAQEIMNQTVTCSVGADFIKDGADVIQRRLVASTLSTYFVFGMSTDHMHHATRLLSIAMNAKGRMIIAGNRIPMHKFGNLALTIKAEPDVVSLLRLIPRKKLREIGSYRLKKFMRE